MEQQKANALFAFKAQNTDEVGCFILLL